MDDIVGYSVGILVGSLDIIILGIKELFIVGYKVGLDEGSTEEVVDGCNVGKYDGEFDVTNEGFELILNEGAIDDDNDG